MCDNPVILNLHYFKRDSYISVICQASKLQWKTEKHMSGLQVAVEDRKADAVAHLAVARSQNTGPAFWGQRKIKAVVLYGRFFLLGTQFTCCIRGAGLYAAGNGRGRTG